MKGKVKNIFWPALKGVLSIEYILGFIPTLLVHYFLNLFKRPESDKQFNKRMLYIQAFVFPVITGTLIAFLAYYFQSFTLRISAIVISGLYIFNITQAQYENDGYVKIVAGGDEKRRIILKRRLIVIKCIMFFFTLLVVGISIPLK